MIHGERRAPANRVEANARLTALTGVVLLVMLAAEGVTTSKGVHAGGRVRGGAARQSLVVAGVVAGVFVAVVARGLAPAWTSGATHAR